MNENSISSNVQPERTQAPKGAAPMPQEENSTSVEKAPLAWPEDISFSQKARESFENLCKEINLSGEQAQKLIDFESCFARQAAQENKETQATWVQETQNFFGPHWQEEISLAVRAADVFGGPELRALLEETGLGNHPVIVRTFNEIGKRISEDVSTGGKTSIPADKTFAEAMYGN